MTLTEIVDAHQRARVMYGLDEALELACLATHLGEEGAAQRWRAAVGAALERERGGVSGNDDEASVTLGRGRQPGAASPPPFSEVGHGTD